MAGQEQIEGLPEGAVIKPLATPQASATQPEQIEGLPEGATVRPLTNPPAKKPETSLLGGIADTGKALYHGLTGEEETPEEKGETTTLSPVAGHLGFEPTHVAHTAGKMVRGIGEFVGGAAKDLASDMPIFSPNEPGSKAKEHGYNGPTFLDKYVTAPAGEEKQAAINEAAQYYNTHGWEAFAHLLNSVVHSAGESIPGVGPLAASIIDKAQKGDIGGALTDVASLYASEKAGSKAADVLKDKVGSKLKAPESNAVKITREDLEAKQKAYDEAKKKYDAYDASRQQGLGTPEKVDNAFQKAHSELAEAQAHHEAAVGSEPNRVQRVGKAVGKTIGKVLPKEESPAEVPTEQIEAAPKAEEKVEPKEPVSTTPPPVSPAHATTTIPREPTERPLVPLGQKELAGGQGTVGMPKLLPEPELEVKPEEKPAEQPKQEVLPPIEKKKAPKPERGNLRALTVDDTGKVIDKEEATPEGRLGRLLKESLTTDKDNPNFPSIKVTSEESPKVSTPKAEEPAKVEPVKLPEDKTHYEPKKEEVLATGEEGREPVKGAAEYHPAVEEQVSHLSDENLRKLAKAHGLNPDEYDFKLRDENRHRVERDQMVKDIMQYMGDDEKINIGRNAERLAHSADTAQKAKAERAASLFPRLRGPVDEFGNPTVAGGAPEGATAPAKDEEAERLKEHVGKTSSKDTDHIHAAMQELGPDAKLSDVMKRAQELKESAGKPVDLKKTVSEYNKKQGLGEVKDNKLEIDPRGKEIARAYDDMKHNPNDPEVKKSYNALIDDAKKQWEALERAGVKFEPQDEDPYKSYEEMKEDFDKNKRMKVFRGGNPLPEDHPLAKVDPKTGETYNVMFRAVHDAIGHLLHDNDFSEKGETNAFDTHRQTMSKEAIPAMTTETKGQVAHFFNKEGGPNGEFPEQKAGLLPERFYDESPDPKKVIDHIKSGKDFALLTAENPGNERATPEENAKRNREMKAELEKMGYKPVPVEGHNADVKGEKENSFFVPDIKPEDAEKISKKYGQASVMTKVGIHDLEKGEIHPAGKMIEGPEAAKQDYHSTVGGKAFSIPVNFDTTVASDIGRWKAPPELGAFSAEDKGQNIRSENERRMGGPLKRGEVERRGGEERRGPDRVQQKAEQDLFNRARRELGEDATTDEVTKLVDHLRELPKPTAENSRLSDEELLKKGYSQEDLDAGRHLPSVSGAKEGAAKAKEPRTGDELIKKYGESSGDPAHTTFILKDGRGVANTGVDHDVMLGGKATDANPLREKFVADGNIRVRPRVGGGREVSMSLPEKGINEKQLAYLMKMQPQLRSGAVLLEVGKPGGDYRIISHGDATEEALHKAISDLVPIKNDKGAPIDQFGNPTVSGGSQSATAPAKEKVKGETPESLREKLPELAQKNLTEQEKEGLTTTATGKARTAGTQKFVENMEKIPEVQEYVDIALQGEGARKWYSRSKAAFEAMAKVAPDVFKKGDLDKFLGMLAGSSPQQSVAMNLREALNFWKEWHDAGRPEFSLDKWHEFGEEADKAWKEDGSPRARGLAKGASMHWDYAPKGEKWKAENLLLKNLTLPETKVPNVIKALNGEDMWPDLTKNQAFKAPSFAQNLRGWHNYVTNDSWMGLFGGIDKSALSKPENYHPLSVATREAAKVLGWEPDEAQAAIWSFTQALTEKGTEDPHTVRQYSEDFKDLMENDLQVRNLLEDLGVNLDDLDEHLRTIEEKPEVSGRTTGTTSRSIGKLKERIETARGKGAIPKPKSAQGSLLEQFHRERPAFEHRNRIPAIRDEATEFEPEKLEAEESRLKKLGEKKNKPKMKSLF